MTDIILVSYKDEIPIKKCIESIEETCSDYRIYIEDNNINNVGFTKAINNAIKKGSSEYILLVNSDVIVLPGAQQALIYRFSYSPKIGIVGSIHLDPNQPDRISHRGTIQAFPFGVHKNGHLSMGHGQIPEKCTWVNFAFVMIKREVIRDVGYLDEDMFLIFSDSDFCYMAREKGWEVWIEPQSKIFHTLNVSKKPTEWHQKDMIAFMKKWDIATDGKGNFFKSRRFEKLDLFP